MIRYLLFISLLIHSAAAKGAATARGKPTTFVEKKWLTLSGKQPAVVARGGFSGLFPESVQNANMMAISTSVNEVVILCNLQLTQDGFGLCQPDVRLDNTTTISSVYPDGSKSYVVNGQNVTGWFAFDYTYKQLATNVTAVQNIFSRPDVFDAYDPISTLDDVMGSKAPAVWINVPYAQVYSEHKLNIDSFIMKTGLQGAAQFIASPEIAFLKTMKAQQTKDKSFMALLFLVFQDKNVTEPTTNQTYGSIAENLATIKPMVDGIAVPKDYIWPVNADGYIDAPTTLVNDAHKLGLRVYVHGFANDMVRVYNYSYDPSAEYLQFVDNSQFSVDGFITDFPPTASQVVACYGKYNDIARITGQPMIISHNGASGDFPGSTDVGYQQAVKDGADVIDCSVQMSQDGVAFCSDSADLTGNTNAITTFMSKSVTVPEIQQAAGVFSFDLTWSDIQTLQPQIVSPFEKNGLQRNPANKNSGKLLTLSAFLELAKAQSVSGVLIDVENAAYLASKKGLDIVGAVSTALTNASLSNTSILIQSDDSSVLDKFQNVSAYKRVLLISEPFGDAPKQSVDEIKKHADAVTLTRSSIVFAPNGFSLSASKVIDEMHAANITVYVKTFMNEVPTLLYDYFTDPTIEIATYTNLKVDGIITEFPKTADRFFRSPCSNLNNNVEFAILPVEAGSLYSSIPQETASLAPAAAPLASLTVKNVVDPPLPAVSAVADSDTAAPAPGSKGKLTAGAVANAGGLTVVAILVISLLLSLGN